MTQYLAIDGGGTHTRAGIYDANGNLLAEASGSGSNPVLLGIDQAAATLVALGQQLTAARSEDLFVAAGISGAGRSRSTLHLARAVGVGLQACRVRITEDLTPLQFANARDADAILVIAGTGSSVLAETADGSRVLVGGRGVLFGDEGSGYHLAESALRVAARSLDDLAPETALVEALPTAAGVSEFSDLVAWSAQAAKEEVAALAPAVLDAGLRGDAAAAECVTGAARALALQANAARRKASLAENTRVFLIGGLFEASESYRDAFALALADTPTTSVPALAPLRGHRAVLELARADIAPAHTSEYESGAVPGDALPQTERVRDADLTIDTMTARDIVRVMNHEDARVHGAVAREADAVAAVIDRTALALNAGGRLIYVGAGTSGRLGVLDASECPPTFGIDPERVVGLIAGGEPAIRQGVEGAEDNGEQARADLRALSPALGSNDVVVGVAASGTTPYVCAALKEAADLGAATALVCCNPMVHTGADIVIALGTGPEVVAGSTRMKAGTATKMVLNMISTGAMARAGLVFEGRMVGMRPVNAKLRQRAIRIVAELADTDEEEASRLLDEAGDSIATAVLAARRCLPMAEASALLRQHKGNLREALADE